MKALAILLGAGLLGVSSQANAAIFLGLQVGNGPISTIADDGGTGNLTYAATFQGFTNSIIIQGYPTLNQPALQTASINTKRTSGSAGTLSVYVTQTDLTPVSGSLLSSFTSNMFQGSALSVVESTMLSKTNAIFSGDLLATNIFTGLGSADYTTAVPSLSGPFSETFKYILTTGAGAASFNNTINIGTAVTSAVPETATWAMMLLGVGLVGGVMRRKPKITTRVQFA